MHAMEGLPLTSRVPASQTGPMAPLGQPAAPHTRRHRHARPVCRRAPHPLLAVDAAGARCMLAWLHPDRPVCARACRHGKRRAGLSRQQPARAGVGVRDRRVAGLHAAPCHVAGAAERGARRCRKRHRVIPPSPEPRRPPHAAARMGERTCPACLACWWGQGSGCCPGPSLLTVGAGTAAMELKARRCRAPGQKTSPALAAGGRAHASSYRILTGGSVATGGVFEGYCEHKCQSPMGRAGWALHGCVCMGTRCDSECSREIKCMRARLLCALCLAPLAHACAVA